MGALGAAVGAIGTWLLYNTEAGKKRRAELTAIGGTIKNEVLAEVRRVKAENEPAVKEAIETIANKYRGLQSIDPQILSKVVDDLKTRWEEVKAEFTEGQQGPEGTSSPS